MSTASPSLSLEESKKKQLRQYKEIIRISKAQSARIKDLQLENERLLSENIDLRSVAINLEEQLESQQLKNEGLQEKLGSLLTKFQGEAESFIKSISQYRQDAQEYFQSWETQATREAESDEEDLDEETFVKETEDILKEANEDVSIKNLSCLLDKNGNVNDHSINNSEKASSSFTRNHETNREQESSDGRSSSGPSKTRFHDKPSEATGDSSNGKDLTEFISNGPETVKTNGNNVQDKSQDQTTNLSSRTSDNYISKKSDVAPVNTDRHIAASALSDPTTNEVIVDANFSRKLSLLGPKVLGTNDDTNTNQQQTKSRSLDEVSQDVEHQPGSPKESDTPSTHSTNSELIKNPQKSVPQPTPTPRLIPDTPSINLQESYRVNNYPNPQDLPEKRKSSLSRLRANSETSDSDEPLCNLKIMNNRFSSEPPRSIELVTSRDNSTASNPLWLQGILNNRASPIRTSKETPNLSHNQHNQGSLYDNLQLLSTVTNLKFFETHAKDEKTSEMEAKEEPPAKKTRRGRPPGSTNRQTIPSSPEQQSRSASEELNDGRSRRERKRVNYALPGLRTKMRRDFNLPTDHSKPRRHRRAKAAEPIAEEAAEEADG
ncbi:shugoshin Sgo2 [Schizosaccharomyces octosporus yFS286]|uniref:Shugoshin Sgo2 n=1 Tax=Schizosaccharomyces octosporus (strain yFS286) TaxID=483514 RepID=S9RIU8_SCHOY|nr:shugoshin Sgo2 [Schizosaccharomyces octosporus yFS286]EPX73934.1 shugoshin Sgo2 [Schizosaccharomyces octosporus yFS286]